MELPSDITWSQVTIQLAKRFCVSGQPECANLEKNWNNWALPFRGCPGDSPKPFESSHLIVDRCSPNRQVQKNQLQAVQTRLASLKTIPKFPIVIWVFDKSILWAIKNTQVTMGKKMLGVILSYTTYRMG